MFSCDECRFDAAERTDHDLATMIAGFGRKYRAPLSRFLDGEDGDALVRSRPAPDVWSALEYAAHVRDVLHFYEDRVRRAFDEDRPQFQAVGFEALAETARYNDADPATVGAEVADVAASFGDLLTGLAADAWLRVGIGSDGDERTVRVLAQRAAHDGHHHLLDIGRSLRAARGR